MKYILIIILALCLFSCRQTGFIENIDYHMVNVDKATFHINVGGDIVTIYEVNLYLGDTLELQVGDNVLFNKNKVFKVVNGN